jgi:hypothetical protein
MVRLVRKSVSIARPGAGEGQRRRWLVLVIAPLSTPDRSSCCIRGATFQVATSASVPTFFVGCRYEYRHGRRDAGSTVPLDKAPALHRPLPAAWTGITGLLGRRCRHGRGLSAQRSVSGRGRGCAACHICSRRETIPWPTLPRHRRESVAARPREPPPRWKRGHRPGASWIPSPSGFPAGRRPAPQHPRSSKPATTRHAASSTRSPACGSSVLGTASVMGDRR